ncbi:MAG: PilZ domain-containing protein [Vicinamibacterales bacterium]|nr:PilZ domain-containing protein [Vicinamibacterales bacterium]
MRDHRKFSRLPIEGSLTGDITVALPLEVTQISAGGVLIETDRPLRLESLHELRFALEGAPLVVRGRVVHSRVADLVGDGLTYESGLEFVDPPVHVQAAIRALLARLSDDAAQG